MKKRSDGSFRGWRWNIDTIKKCEAGFWQANVLTEISDGKIEVNKV